MRRPREEWGHVVNGGGGELNWSSRGKKSESTEGTDIRRRSDGEGRRLTGIAGGKKKIWALGEGGGENKASKGGVGIECRDRKACADIGKRREQRTLLGVKEGIHVVHLSAEGSKKLQKRGMGRTTKIGPGTRTSSRLTKRSQKKKT